MKANIIEGIYFRIQGEEGATNALSWEVFKKMGDHLQNLVISLAKYNLDDDAAPDLDAFEIEVFDFKPGSAVPAFRLRQPKQLTLHQPIQDQQDDIASSIDKLLSIANTGHYGELKKLFHSEAVRSTIAKDLFAFVNAAPTAPVSVVKHTKDGKFRKIYEVHKFKRQQLESLVSYTPVKKEDKSEEFVALVTFSQTAKRKAATLKKVFNKAEVSYSPLHIIVEGFTYNMHYPLLCRMYEEDKYYVIENQLMDLIATGLTEEEAELNFNEEFHAKYQRLMELSNIQLSERLLRAKQAFQLIVKEVIED